MVLAFRWDKFERGNGSLKEWVGEVLMKERAGESLLESVWIHLIFDEIENWNWKHYSEIIFKCVNSAVGPIFNEKVAEKCNLWDPWTVHGCTVHSWLVNNCGLNKKKEKTCETRNATVDVESKHILIVFVYFYVLYDSDLLELPYKFLKGPNFYRTTQYR